MRARSRRFSFARCCLTKRARAFRDVWVRKKRFFAAFIPRLNALSFFVSLAQVTAATASKGRAEAAAGTARAAARATTAGQTHERLTS